MPSTFNTLIPTRYGTMLVNRNDAYVGRSLLEYGEFSPGEARLFQHFLRPGMTAVEVGANIGAHTLLLSRLVGNTGAVYAYEPQRLQFQALCANLSLNSLINVEAVQAVVTNTGTSHMEFVMLDPFQAGNFGAFVKDGAEGAHRERVRTVMLDEHLADIPSLHFLKIDVEGHECEVLRSGCRLIAKHRPIIYCENDRPERSDELIALLRSYGYRLWWDKPALYEAGNWNGNPVDVFSPEGSLMVSENMLCLPAEMDCKVEGKEITDDTPTDH